MLRAFAGGRRPQPRVRLLEEGEVFGLVSLQHPFSLNDSDVPRLFTRTQKLRYQ